MVSVEVHPVTPDRWDDVVEVFGRRGQDPSWCWCQRFLRPPLSAAARADEVPDGAGGHGEDHRAALRAEALRSDVPPGLVAHVAGRPVGWTRVGPRACFPGVTANRALARVLPADDGAWWVTCFAVDGRHRRLGTASALLQAAVALAREHGATAVEGHPVDVAGLRTSRVSGSALFTGTLATFVRAGFTEVARTSPTRPVMRRQLEENRPAIRCR